MVTTKYISGYLLHMQFYLAYKHPSLKQNPTLATLMPPKLSAVLITISSPHRSLPTAALSSLSVQHLTSLHHRFYTFQVQQMHKIDSAFAHAKRPLFLIEVILQEANANYCLPYIRHSPRDLVIKSLTFTFHFTCFQYSNSAWNRLCYYFHML